MHSHKRFQYHPLRGVIVRTAPLLTSTLLHISHVCLLYCLKAFFVCVCVCVCVCVSGLDEYSAASLSEALEDCDGANVMYLYNFVFLWVIFTIPTLTSR